MEINWKTPNIKITEPIQKDFVGQHLDVVEKHASFMKITLLTMGIQNEHDQDLVVEKIKILVSGEEGANDVWEKTDSNQKNDETHVSKPKSSSDWN